MALGCRQAPQSAMKRRISGSSGANCGDSLAILQSPYTNQNVRSVRLHSNCVAVAGVSRKSSGVSPHPGGGGASSVGHQHLLFCRPLPAATNAS